jgi:hypothetical protein
VNTHKQVFILRIYPKKVFYFDFWKNSKGFDPSLKLQNRQVPCENRLVC